MIDILVIRLRKWYSLKNQSLPGYIVTFRLIWKKLKLSGFLAVVELRNFMNHSKNLISQIVELDTKFFILLKRLGINNEQKMGK